MDSQDLSLSISVGMSQNSGACPVPENDAGGPIFKVDPIGDDFSTYHKSVVV
jgi:hypothetical protein